MSSLETLLLIGGGLIFISIIIARLTDNLGIPTLILFLGIGMLAGSEGPGGIRFDDPEAAQSIGVAALVFILFAGGLDLQWSRARTIVPHALGLSTLGVLLTALCVAVFMRFVLGFPLLYSLLVGAVISSTDAAAVFSVLRTRKLALRGRLRPLLELESGSNDPMALFLTIGIIEVITIKATAGDLVWLFVKQMALGTITGLGAGKMIVLLVNRLRLTQEGLYPVFVMAAVALLYAVTAIIGGSGFLAVYIAGIIAGTADIVYKKTLLRFFNGFAWLGQIAMFLTLGLLVQPSELLPVIGSGLLISGFLMFAARPVAVYLTLAFTRFRWQHKAFVSWVGLRGAVPIVLATFPLLAGIPQAQSIFNLVFFIVLTSTLLQGWSIGFAAKIFFALDSSPPRAGFPIEPAPGHDADTILVELPIAPDSAVAGKTIVEADLPENCLIVLINRNNKFVIPSGGTELLAGDVLQVVVPADEAGRVRALTS
jgi:cell volume regulation protein A